jgi:hypothetical protein
VEEVLAITMGTPKWLQEIKSGYATYMVTQKLLSELEQPTSSIKHLTWDGDLLRYKRQIWVGGKVCMHQTILQTLHESAIGSHSGVQATLQHVKQLFAWPKM